VNKVFELKIPHQLSQTQAEIDADTEDQDTPAARDGERGPASCGSLRLMVPRMI